jgi:hypothetical protein
MQLNKRAARRRWRGGGDPVESTEEEAIFGYAYGWYVCRRQSNTPRQLSRQCWVIVDGILGKLEPDIA